MPLSHREKMGDTTLHQLSTASVHTRSHDYIIAVLVVPIVLTFRALLDPLAQNDYLFVMTLLGVVFSSWRGGLGPGLVTLTLSTFGMLIFMRMSWSSPDIGTILATIMFVICGICCAGLGEAQWVSRRRARDALSIALERKSELEAEMTRRREAELSVKKRENDLLEINRQLVDSQQKIAEALEEVRGIADSVPVMIWMSDEEPRRRYFNATWLAFTGRTLEQELGDGWYSNVHPGDRDYHRRIYSQAFEKREGFEIEYRLLRHDGEYRWVLARGTPRITSNGRFMGFCGVCLDVTEQKTATEALSASERRFRAIGERFKTLTEMIPEIVWTANRDRQITFINHRWETFTGQSLNTDTLAKWHELVHPEDRETIERDWVRADASTNAEFRCEFRLRNTVDDSYRWMLIRSISLRDSAGQVIEWVGSFSDIDEQKKQSEFLEELVQQRTTALREEVEERSRIEHQLRTLTTELRRSNGELEQFAYVASHDLQEPLRKIQAFGDRLRIKCGESLSETGKEYLERMNSSASRMRRLIDDLLTFSRVSSQARPFHHLDLGRIVRDVISDLDEYIQQNSATVEVGPLPSLDADPTQLGQLFQNLIANAIKFHRPNVPPVVRIEAKPPTESTQNVSEECQTHLCQITVSDNGIGFQEKYLDRIFQVFQRLHGREEYEGTGVGLAICRKIVERHGGTITARSQVGVGTTFIVSLPIWQRPLD